ncbi:MAG: T9SS type A sorting domain-containing protein [Bacteroidota bacterium]|nr:T9SS type A sorting domain-containing protein [Bacteroidota bacterium]
MNFAPQISLSEKTYQPEKENNHQRGFYGYNIWRNDELIEGAWPESHYSDTLTETGEYAYYISAVYDQCESDTTGMVSISLFTDIKTPASKQNQINIYPNPASDQLFIAAEAQDAIIHHFTLTSVSGQPVLSLSPESRRIRLDVSLLPKGIYLAEIFSGEKREFRKIIIY